MLRIFECSSLSPDDAAAALKLVNAGNHEDSGEQQQGLSFPLIASSAERIEQGEIAARLDPLPHS